MLEKYQPHFGNLDTSHVSYLAQAISRAYALEVPDATSGLELWQFCEEAGMDQADVVMSLARDCTVDGVVCIETLLGRPIVRAVPKPPRRAARPRGAARPRTDGRRVVRVHPNPKRPGTKSYERFALYQEGLTVTETIALPGGPTKDDIRWDSDRGFIELGD